MVSLPVKAFVWLCQLCCLLDLLCLQVVVVNATWPRQVVSELDKRYFSRVSNRRTIFYTIIPLSASEEEKTAAARGADLQSGEKAEWPPRRLVYKPPPVPDKYKYLPYRRKKSKINPWTKPGPSTPGPIFGERIILSYRISRDFHRIDVISDQDTVPDPNERPLRPERILATYPKADKLDISKLREFSVFVSSKEAQRQEEAGLMTDNRHLTDTMRAVWGDQATCYAGCDRRSLGRDRTLFHNWLNVTRADPAAWAMLSRTSFFLYALILAKRGGQRIREIELMPEAGIYSRSLVAHLEPGPLSADEEAMVSDALGPWTPAEPATTEHDREAATVTVGSADAERDHAPDAADAHADAHAQSREELDDPLALPDIPIDWWNDLRQVREASPGYWPQEAPSDTRAE